MTDEKKPCPNKQEETFTLIQEIVGFRDDVRDLKQWKEGIEATQARDKQELLTRMADLETQTAQLNGNTLLKMDHMHSDMIIMHKDIASMLVIVKSNTVVTEPVGKLMNSFKNKSAAAVIVTITTSVIFAIIYALGGDPELLRGLINSWSPN